MTWDEFVKQQQALENGSFNQPVFSYAKIPVGADQAGFNPGDRDNQYTQGDINKIVRYLGNAGNGQYQSREEYAPDGKGGYTDSGPIAMDYSESFMDKLLPKLVLGGIGAIGGAALLPALGGAGAVGDAATDAYAGATLDPDFISAFATPADTGFADLTAGGQALVDPEYANESAKLLQQQSLADNGIDLLPTNLPSINTGATTLADLLKSGNGLSSILKSGAGLLGATSGAGSTAGKSGISSPSMLGTGYSNQISGGVGQAPAIQMAGQQAAVPYTSLQNQQVNGITPTQVSLANALTNPNFQPIKPAGEQDDQMTKLAALLAAQQQD